MTTSDELRRDALVRRFAERDLTDIATRLKLRPRRLLEVEPTKLPPMSFGDWLRVVRIQKGMSQRQVADASGGLVSHGRVGQIEQRDIASNYQDEVLQGISRALGVPVKEVYRRADVKAPGQLPQLPDEARWIPPAQWKHIRELIRSVGLASRDIPPTTRGKPDPKQPYNRIISLHDATFGDKPCPQSAA